jgi:hypothetical protein
MAADLHCSPPSNTLEHGVEVTGHGKSFMVAVVDAFTKLSVDVDFAEKAIRRDAQAAKCPDECNKKTISNFFILRGITFAAGYDSDKDDWHCTMGVGGELDVMCEPPREGDPPEKGPVEG